MASRDHPPGVEIPLALTIDEMTWLHASETICQSPVQEVLDKKLEANYGQDRTWPTSNVTLSSNPPRAGSKPSVWLLSPSIPIPSSTLTAEPSSRPSEHPDTSLIRDTPRSSSRAHAISAIPRLTLSTEPRTLAPSLHRNRTWHKNRHYHVGGNSTPGSDLSPSPTSPIPSISVIPLSSPSSIPSSLRTGPSTSHPPSTPPRTPHPRCLPAQRTEWIYRQPKPRAPPSLSVSTTLAPPPAASCSPAKHITTSPPSRIPIRPRTRSSSRMNLKARSCSQPSQRAIDITGIPAKKPIHSTLPARPSLTQKTAVSPSSANNGVFWSNLLSRSKSNTGKRCTSEPVTPTTTGSSSFEFLDLVKDLAKEKYGTASSSLLSLSLDASQTSQDNHDKDKRKEEKTVDVQTIPSIWRHPSQRSTVSAAATPPSTAGVSKIPKSIGLISTFSHVPIKISTEPAACPPSTSRSPGYSPSRSRSSSSSSHSSKSSSTSTAHSLSTGETSMSSHSVPTSLDSAAPLTPSSRSCPIPTVVSASPSKSILSRSSSTASQRLPSTLATLFGSGPNAGCGTPTKSVTFVDVPTVHYATYSDRGDDSDVNDMGFQAGAADSSSGGTENMALKREAGKIGHGLIGGGKSGSGCDTKGRYGGYRGYQRRDCCMVSDSMDVDRLPINEEDEEDEDEDEEAMGSHSSTPYPGGITPGPRLRRHQQPQLQPQLYPPRRSNTTSSLRRTSTEVEGGSGSLKRFMSLSRQSGEGTTTAKHRVRGHLRPIISGPFALGSLPLSSPSSSPPPSPTPQSTSTVSPPFSNHHSRTNSSTASLRSFLSYSASLNYKKGPNRSASTRSGHYKSHSYSGRTQFPFTPSPDTTVSNSPYDNSRGPGFYHNTLRAVPSMESFKSVAGRSVRSLGSVKSTASTSGFRAWLAKVGEGIGIRGTLEDDDE